MDLNQTCGLVKQVKQREGSGIQGVWKGVLMTVEFKRIRRGKGHEGSEGEWKVVGSVDCRLWWSWEIVNIFGISINIFRLLSGLTHAHAQKRFHINDQAFGEFAQTQITIVKRKKKKKHLVPDNWSKYRRCVDEKT